MMIVNYNSFQNFFGKLTFLRAENAIDLEAPMFNMFIIVSKFKWLNDQEDMARYVFFQFSLLFLEKPVTCKIILTSWLLRAYYIDAVKQGSSLSMFRCKTW